MTLYLQFIDSAWLLLMDWRLFGASASATAITTNSCIRVYQGCPNATKPGNAKSQGGRVEMINSS